MVYCQDDSWWKSSDCLCFPFRTEIFWFWLVDVRVNSLWFIIWTETLWISYVTSPRSFLLHPYMAHLSSSSSPLLLLRSVFLATCCMATVLRHPPPASDNRFFCRISWLLHHHGNRRQGEGWVEAQVEAASFYLGSVFQAPGGVGTNGRRDENLLVSNVHKQFLI